MAKRKRHSSRSGAFYRLVRLGKVRLLLVELNFLDLDHLLAVLFRDRAYDGAFFGLLADFLVVLLAGIFVKFIDRIFDFDDSLALIRRAQIALGASDGAFEGFFLGLFVVCADAQSQNAHHGQTENHRERSLHYNASLIPQKPCNSIRMTTRPPTVSSRSLHGREYTGSSA